MVRWLTAFWLVLLWSAPALASGGEHGFSLKVHGFYLVNFVLFLAILVLFGRKPLAGLVRDRSDAFKRRLDAARAEHDKTQARLHKAQSQVANLPAEKATVQEHLQAEGEKTRSAIAARTLEEERKLKNAAEAALANEKARLEKEFQADLALASLQAAEERLDVNWKALPQQRFVADFVEQLATLEQGEESRG